MERLVTIFPNSHSPGKPYKISVDKIVGRIRDGKSKDKIGKLRSMNKKDNPKEYANLKEDLPSICFSGIFSYRADDKIIKHSGLVAIDFDHLGSRLMDFRSKIVKDKHTFITFISPSGDGLKVVIKIPPSIETHKMSCAAIVDYYKDESLDNFDDLSRICFESFDPGIYYNPDSEIFTVLKEKSKPTSKAIITGDNIVVDFDEIIDRLVVWLSSVGEEYCDGNKHKYIVRLSAACNRFGIPEGVCTQKLIYRFISKASSVDPQDFNNIVKSVYRNYGHLACTAHFNVGGKIANNVTNVQIEDSEMLNITLPMKDVIFLDNVRDSMVRTFYAGSARGETTYYPEIDEAYRMKRGELTIVHGIMNHGKTTMLIQLCLIKAVRDGYKFAVFSPEQNPPDDFYDNLVHMYMGKNTQPYYNDQMTIEEYQTGMDFIKDHFYYIYPEDEAPKIEYINERFIELIKKYKVDGCIIDPYNQLDNDMKKAGGREDLYLSSILTKQKRFAQENNVFMWIVTHPKSDLQKNKEGNYNIPDVYDLSGGAMWSNKSDNVICVYRPYYSSDKTSPVTWFTSQKIKKQRLCGRPGQVVMTFDWNTQRYHIITNSKFHPLDDVVIKKETDRNDDNIYSDTKDTAPF